MSKARDMLHSISEQMFIRSTDSHAKGVAEARQSGRVHTMATYFSDAQAEKAVEAFQKHGLIRLIDGVAVLLPASEVDDFVTLTSKGGDS